MVEPWTYFKNGFLVVGILVKYTQVGVFELLCWAHSRCCLQVWLNPFNHKLWSVCLTVACQSITQPNNCRLCVSWTALSLSDDKKLLMKWPWSCGSNVFVWCPCRVSSISCRSGKKGSEVSTALFCDPFSDRHRLFISSPLETGKSNGCHFLELLPFADVL